MKRCSLRAWIPILPMPVWPLAWQCLLGQNTVVGSMRCSFWLCVEACQEEYVGIPIFTTSALHHGSGQRYRVKDVLASFGAERLGHECEAIHHPDRREHMGGVGALLAPRFQQAERPAPLEQLVQQQLFGTAGQQAVPKFT